MNLFRPLFDLASPGGEKGRLSTLVFHRVSAEPDPIFPEEIDAPRFERICSWLAQTFNVLPLDEAIRQLGQGRLPPRAMAITFDDGYLDNLEVAAPILRRHGLCATFFIATGFLDGGRMWNDTVIEAVRHCRKSVLDAGEFGHHPLIDLPARRQAIETLIDRIKYLDHAQRLLAVEKLASCAQARLPDDLMLSSVQVRQLHASGMQIGAHTVGHPILARLNEAAAASEIDTSRQVLQRITGSDVTMFAYPNGRPGEDYSPESVRIVRALGFDGAVTTDWGAGHRHTSSFEIPRFTPWDLTSLRFNGRLLANLWRSRPGAAG